MITPPLSILIGDYLDHMTGVSQNLKFFYINDNINKAEYNSSQKRRRVLYCHFHLRMASVEEFHNYPFDPIIKFKQPGRSFSYKVINEGVYPSKSSLAYTLPPNKYRIPNDYIVETTWGKNQCVVQCFINYNDDKPVFQIRFGKYFECEVSSVKSTTDAANLFHKVCIKLF